MKGWLLSVSIGLSLTAFAAQATEIIAGDDLKTLASDKTWAISFYGDPDKPGLTNVWDFRKNGTLCARGAGSKSGEKCADEGKWSVKDKMLCWELTWMGEGAGTKAVCATANKSANDRFELHNQKTPDLVFAVFKVLY